jgi:hypothetical protein
LLDLARLDPRDGASPSNNVHRRDHSSSSGLRCSITFQRALRSTAGFDFPRRRCGSSSTHGSGRRVEH